MVSALLAISGWGMMILPGQSMAAEVARTLENVEYSPLANDQIEFKFTLRGAPLSGEPLSFTTTQPARIAFDLPETASTAPKRKSVGIGAVQSVNAVEAKGRTRIVINLSRLVDYQTRVEDGVLYVHLDNEVKTAAAAVSQTGDRPAKSGVASSARQIEKVDFRRGPNGEGRIIVTLSDEHVPVSLQSEGERLVARFSDAQLPKSLRQRLDVLDFATPVSYIDNYPEGRGARLVVTAAPPFEHMAYQSGKIFTIEVKQPAPGSGSMARDGSPYVGEKLSLNFQDIEVRAVLQLIADFTDLNMVISDSVKGNVTLRLENVPWDQGLDIILQTRGLDKRRMGNVMLVAPAAEIAAREKEGFESMQQIDKLAPLITEMVQINYAKAADIATLLKGKESSMLSDRGNVSIDERTNSMLINDTAEKISAIRTLVAKLDIPIKQVLIESRVVIANDDFSRELGARFGVSQVADMAALNGNLAGTGAVTGSLTGTETIVTGAAPPFNISGSLPALNDRLNVSLPVIGQAGRLALAILGGDYMLDLELSAMQAEGRGEVLSNPRVVTSDQNEAIIEQGVEIPYQQASSSGATNVSFKKAVLSLKVKPQITPDKRVIMDLDINKDSESGKTVLGVPSIDTRHLTTQVLVNNGDTIVLGGVYEQVTTDSLDKVPFFGDLPVIGAMFRHTVKKDNKAELLVFVTPKILEEKKLARQ
ncbi:MAG: type IV pilus secretin PilQ [Gammaproteobacteria bacterium]|nr:type IV pilus secretin PilQ [Gammaproteobacteria bacterium]